VPKAWIRASSRMRTRLPAPLLSCLWTGTQVGSCNDRCLFLSLRSSLLSIVSRLSMSLSLTGADAQRVAFSRVLFWFC
jgi:hypothetical protein